MSEHAPFTMALTGCGRISERHFEAIGRQPALKIVGVCDTILERAETWARKLGVPAFADHEQMLDTVKPQVAVLASPSGLHSAQGIAAADRKIHVITEKPMSTRLSDADALVHACDRNHVQLFVVKQNRLNPPIQYLRRAIDKDRFGRLYLCSAHVLWSRPQSYYDSAKWRGTWEFDGGAFMNQASHYIDLVQWLMGPVESVMAKTATLGRKIETEDTGAAILKFRNGAIGVIEVTMLAYPRNLEGSITILGERGSVRIGGTAVNAVQDWHFDAYDDDDREVEALSGANPPTVYGLGHRGYYENVVAVLEGRAEPDTDGRSGRKSLELILGIYESARTGRDVPLPLAH